MRDQAEALRARARTEVLPSPPLPAAFVIGSGKGGVGKSALSVLLATALAREDRRVLLLDGAQNQGNLHVLLGVRPKARLEALLEGEIDPEGLLVPLRDNLRLLPGESGAESLYALTPMDRARLHRRLSSLYEGFDAVVIDAGPGIDSVVRATIRASRLVVVAVPEPASLSDAYALIKIVNLQVPSLGVDVIVNRVASEAEASTAYGRLELAASRFLNRTLRCIGSVPDDPQIARAVRHPGALLDHHSPEAARIVARLLEPAPEREPAPASPPTSSLEPAWVRDSAALGAVERAVEEDVR